MRYSFLYFALASVLIAPAASSKIVTYEYVGAEYDYIVDPATDPTALSNPFLTAEQKRVTGQFRLNTDYLASKDHRNATIDFFIPLHIGCELEGCKPDLIPQWNFFDGVNDMSRWTAAQGVQRFKLTTDAQGDITSWSILLLEEYEEFFITDRGDKRRLVQCGDWASSQNDCVRSSTAGNWKQVPEPGALGLIGAGLFAAFWLRRSQKLKRTPA
jgi:hypothetical protein